MSCEEQEIRPPRNVDNSYPFTPDAGSNDVAKESNQAALKEERLASKMISYAREIICLILALTFTALATLHISSPKISKPPTAKPFFNQSSIVLDFYKGHLSAMVEGSVNSEFLFVMYYAPWDADSQAVRQEFEKVAHYYQSQVFFAAINCWHPSSECRTQYNKIPSYPVLTLYPAGEPGIHYKGIHTAPYMIRFLHAFINPIVRITHKKDLMQLLVNRDAVVVGYFNFVGLAKSRGYKEFYKAAINSLKRDPNREFVFAVVTDVISSERDFNIAKFPSLSLFMWNKTLNYPEDREWTSDSIINWISSKIYQPVLWLQPPGIKALTLAPYLREGPVLFLFTPRNPFHFENYNYNLIKEIGLEYNNCADNPVIKNIIKHLEEKRHRAMTWHSIKTKQCIALLNKSEAYANEATVSVSIQQWINESCCAKVAMNKCLLCKKQILSLLEEEMSVCPTIHELINVCRDTDIFKIPILESNLEKYEFCCNKDYITLKLHKDSTSKSTQYKTKLFMENNDPQSANTVKQSFVKEDCRRWLMGEKYHHPIFPRDSYEDHNMNLTRLMCESNKTLTFIVMDSLYYFHFAEGLGIDILKKKDKTAVVIVDTVQESEYVMKEDFSKYAVVQFINNYTRGFLQRTLRSDNSKHFIKKYKNKLECKEQDASKICISELTTEVFLDTILDSTKDVVVMYHSPYCAFCNAISYVYLTVAHYLSKMDHLKFVRVDGDNNDLPWEYSMNHFPSILFFPAKRKEDSTVFPFSLPINIQNLLNFILANLDPDSRIEALVNICHLGISDTPSKCIARIRWLCLDVIEHLLLDYRKLRRHLNYLDKRIARTKRKQILLKLENIRYIHLILGSTFDLVEDRNIVHLIRKKFRNYYRTVRLLDLDSKINRHRLNNVGNIKVTNSTNGNTVKDEL